MELDLMVILQKYMKIIGCLLLDTIINAGHEFGNMFFDSFLL